MLKPPNIAIFIDVVAIYMFLFLFLPLYREPVFQVSEIDTENAFPILRDLGNGKYKKLVFENGISEIDFIASEGIVIGCDGWCKELIESYNLKEKYVIFIRGSNFEKIAQNLLTSCVGLNAKPCHRDRSYILTGSSVVIEYHDIAVKN